ncbi:MAG TPA: DUF4142 domain-containing protein [Cellvibrio sp.]|nr:DUF4142 domain-containing protein [Cellvibrio sp.]
MSRFKTLLIVLTVLFLSTPFAQATSRIEYIHTDARLDTRSFIAIAVRTAALEIKTAKLALIKSQSPVVQAYALQVAEQQHQVLTGLQKLAIANGVTLEGDLPLQAGGVAPWVEGDKFDRIYSDRRVHYRQQWVTLLRMAISSNDETLKHYARSVLPASLQQLNQAQQLQRAMHKPA